MKTEIELQNMMMIALNACEIDFIGDDANGDDPHSVAVRLVREVLNDMREMERK